MPQASELLGRADRQLGRLPDGPLVLGRERLLMVALDLRLRSLVIGVRAIQPYTFGRPGFVDVGAQNVPALAQVQHAVMALAGPAPRRDPNPFLLSQFGGAPMNRLACARIWPSQPPAAILPELLPRPYQEDGGPMRTRSPARQDPEQS